MKLLFLFFKINTLSTESSLMPLLSDKKSSCGKSCCDVICCLPKCCCKNCSCYIFFLAILIIGVLYIWYFLIGDRDFVEECRKLVCEKCNQNVTESLL
jgi:hypothetical protein